MVDLYELTGPVFERAKKQLESRGPRDEYMASAVLAADGYYYAAYAAPGWIPSFVYGERGLPDVFYDIKAAETKAREMLFNHLNANLEAGWVDGLWEEISN